LINNFSLLSSLFLFLSLYLSIYPFIHLLIFSLCISPYLLSSPRLLEGRLQASRSVCLPNSLDVGLSPYIHNLFEEALEKYEERQEQAVKAKKGVSLSDSMDEQDVGLSPSPSTADSENENDLLSLRDHINTYNSHALRLDRLSSLATSLPLPSGYPINTQIESSLSTPIGIDAFLSNPASLSPSLSKPNDLSIFNHFYPQVTLSSPLDGSKE
jgi:hypothetical protein